jgi:ATP-dependent DNA ligase
VRKATLASVLTRAAPGLRLNEHIDHDGPSVFAHACRMGLEGIVSKRKVFTLSVRTHRRLDQIEEP